MILGVYGQRTATFLHVLCCLWAIFAIVGYLGLPQSARREKETTYGGHWKHLTFLNQVLQAMLFVLCVVIDFVHLCSPYHETLSALLVPVRDFIFSVFVFPVGLFVAVVFWGLYAYDRELVYPRELDEVNPIWLNHSMDIVGTLYVWDLGISSFGSAQYAWKTSIFLHRLRYSDNVLFPWVSANKKVMGKTQKTVIR
ncbi:androgen-dependent TFPI-regulating protein-like isoform X2 [Sphaerodactylus townsendi]|uniref:androgen-dependent TFPI-regulating protein-like isoform X2 n=1 Tax=Sphaerodactylus townsendi TaxID=933632 RepID=UPI002025C778|nr:androgen-dependent TFPI-regulating protein-like isoform X2 [Sphaerodactylus townsendi]